MDATLLRHLNALILAENVLYEHCIMNNTPDMLLPVLGSLFFRGVFEELSEEA